MEGFSTLWSVSLVYSSSHSVDIYQTAPLIDAGNQNPPQEGVSATSGTTGSRTSDINEGVLLPQ